MDIFITLIAVMVSQVYTYIQTQQIVYIKYVQFLYQLHLNKVVLKKRKKENVLTICYNLSCEQCDIVIIS